MEEVIGQASSGGVVRAMSKQGFEENWDTQLGCPGQADPAVRDAVWTDVIASDPLRQGWGVAHRVQPALNDGIDREAVMAIRVPIAMVGRDEARVLIAEPVDGAPSDAVPGESPAARPTARCEPS